MQQKQQQQPTPGPVEISEIKDYDGEIISRGIARANGAFLNYGTEYEMFSEADASLIAEAFNVHHETGATPRQMQALIGELLGALERGLADDLDGHARDEAQDAVAKARGEMRIETPRQLAQQRDELRDELGDAITQLEDAAKMLERSGWVTDAKDCRLHADTAREALTTTTRPTPEIP